MEADLLSGHHLRELLLTGAIGNYRRIQTDPATVDGNLSFSLSRSAASESVTGAMVVAGWMRRLTRAGKWRRRWVELRCADCLLVYSKAPSSKSAGVIPLSHAFVVKGPWIKGQR